MTKHWWKILGVILLLYSFIIGIIIPLKPGIVNVTPSSAKSGQTVSFKVSSYNTYYKEAEGNIRAWLKLSKEHNLAAQSVQVLSDNDLTLSFVIPSILPSDKKVNDFVLIIDDPVNGAAVMPSAVFITQIDSPRGPPSPEWALGIQNLHQKDSKTYPYRNILAETIRNTYYHVPFWFAMMIIFIVAVVYSWRYLTTKNPDFDYKASAFTKVGILYGIIGLITGAIWAKHTWGEYWSFDPKQNMSAIAMLVYLAYYVLRSSFEDEEKKARISAVYNIFAFSTLIPLLFVIPRLVDSLHPGNGGNPGFGGDDLDSTMRMVLYPAVIGWTLFATWIANVLYRMDKLKERLYDF